MTTTKSKTPAQPCPVPNPITILAAEYQRPVLPFNTTMATLSSAERGSILARSLSEMLEAQGLGSLSRLAWVLYLEASGSAEAIAEELGVEANR